VLFVDEELKDTNLVEDGLMHLNMLFCGDTDQGKRMTLVYRIQTV
jgi:hypothetical protein